MTPERKLSFIDMTAELCCEFITRVRNGENGKQIAGYVQGYLLRAAHIGYMDRELALRITPDQPCETDPYEINDPKYSIPPHQPVVYRCKAIDGCGWQGRDPYRIDPGTDDPKIVPVYACPKCGSLTLCRIEGKAVAV